MPESNSKGRQDNDAEPLGSRPGLVSDAKAKKTGEKERRTAGPDGPSAAAVAAMTTGRGKG